MEIHIAPHEFVELFKAWNSVSSTPQLPPVPMPIALLSGASTTPSYYQHQIQGCQPSAISPAIDPADAYLALAEVMGYGHQASSVTAIVSTTPTTVETTAIVPTTPPAQTALDRIHQVTAGLQQRSVDLGNAEIEDEIEDRHALARLVFKVLVGGALGLLAATAFLGLSGRTAPGFANLLLMRIPYISSEESKPASSPGTPGAEVEPGTEKPAGDEPVTMPTPPPPPTEHQPPSGAPAYPLPAVETK